MTPQAMMYHGQIVHRRFTPLRHRLSYRVFNMLLPLNGIDTVCAKTHFLSHNKFNLVSFHDVDHGQRDGTDVQVFVHNAFKSAGLHPEDFTFYILSFPRVLGYAFNPMTTYYAIDQNGQIAAMLYEVSNTFGEHTHYLVAGGDTRNGVLAQNCRKAFHVSPFNDVDGEYGFRITKPGDMISLGVSLRHGGEAILNATFSGTGQPLTNRTLLMAVLHQPLMTWKVIAGIHFEALRLWLKGLKLKAKPAFNGLRLHKRTDLVDE